MCRMSAWNLRTMTFVMPTTREISLPSEPSTRLYSPYRLLLNASKLIMRPERVAEEQLDPCLGQTDSRYDEAHQQESGPVSENGAPHPRAGARNHCGDDYESRPVARRARAIQCGWHPDHRQGERPGTGALATRSS